MSRLRSGADLIDDAYKRADAAGDTDRHPRTDVLRYVNQGKAELRDVITDKLGASYFRSTSPWTFTTTTDTILYTTGFPATFYELISVRVDCSGCRPVGLDRVGLLEEPGLLDKAMCYCWPSHYDLRPGGIAIYPRHIAGLTVTVEYIPVSDDVLDTTSSFVDGVNGWEDYIAAYAARRIAEKDDDEGVVASCEQEMEKLVDRIQRLAPKRDKYRPKRVQDVRGARMFGRMRGGGGA